jgi:hypothetical protein
MSKELYARIAVAFDAIYAQGDNGLEYMDRHEAMDEELMQHFYNDSVETLSVADKTRMAEMLETIVADMDFDLESF